MADSRAHLRSAWPKSRTSRRLSDREAPWPDRGAAGWHQPRNFTTKRRRRSGRRTYIPDSLAVRKRGTMATHIAFHEVEDVEHWLRSPKREEVFGPLGITMRAFRDPEVSNRVGLIAEIPDLT